MIDPVLCDRAPRPIDRTMHLEFLISRAIFDTATLDSGSRGPVAVAKIASGDEATDNGTDEADNEAREAEESTEAVKGHDADDALVRHGQ
jgi:hypothetical protein